MNVHEKAIFISKTLDRLFPKLEIPLSHENPYALLIAVMLSAQCMDFVVNKVTKELFGLADNPRAMSLLSENQIAEIGRPCGLVNRKARAILATSKLLLEKFHGCVPETSKSWSRCLDWVTKLLQLLWHKRFTGPHSQLTHTSLAYR